MPETPAQWYARVRAGIETDGYRAGPWAQWPTWPFEGDLEVRALAPPADEGPRTGVGGVDCAQCERSRVDDPSAYIFWRDDLAMLGAPFQESSLPFRCYLMPRRHADLSDLTREEAARLGELLMYAERAACDVLEVPRVHVARWGDGTEHLHWWLFARPTGMAQLRGTFVTLWEDLLPVLDPVALRADLDLVAARLVELAGGTALPAPER